MDPNEQDPNESGYWMRRVNIRKPLITTLLNETHLIDLAYRAVLDFLVSMYIGTPVNYMRLHAAFGFSSPVLTDLETEYRSGNWTTPRIIFLAHRIGMPEAILQAWFLYRVYLDLARERQGYVPEIPLLTSIHPRARRAPMNPTAFAAPRHLSFVDRAALVVPPSLYAPNFVVELLLSPTHDPQRRIFQQLALRIQGYFRVIRQLIIAIEGIH